MRVRRASLCLSLLLAAAALVPVRAVSQDGLFHVDVQLKWVHQFQAAGFYAAIKQGYFNEAGLNVNLVEGGPETDPIQKVVNGEAEFGIATSSLILARSRGVPVQAVAAIFQHSPYILVARQDPDLIHASDLEGETVMVEPHAEELLTYLHREGVNVDRINMIEHSGNPLVLAEGRVAAMTAYSTMEPHILNHAGIPYRIFDPKSAGIDFYGDTLFTSDAFARRFPERVAAFRDAMLRGWRYALNNQDEIIDYILANHATPRDRDQLEFEANAIHPLLLTDFIELGYMNPERWRHIADQFRSAGFMQERVDIDAFMFREQQSWAWVVGTFLAAGLVILVIVAVLGKLYVLNRGLKREIRERQTLEDQLQSMVRHDPGTNLLNRRGFFEAAGHELSRADRNGSPLCLMVLDLDRFKAVNDKYGHACGDTVLSRFGSICKAYVRDVDLVARTGGEEFLILLSDTTLESAVLVAERIRRTIESSPVEMEAGAEVTVTVSIGVAERLRKEALDLLIARADKAMYRAKEQGRNRVVIANMADS